MMLMQKWTVFLLSEGLVKIIVNIIRGIVSFDNLEILQTVSLKAKAKSRKKTSTKVKV